MKAVIKDETMGPDTPGRLGGGVGGGGQSEGL